MTYSLLAVGFLLVALLIAAIAVRGRRRTAIGTVALAGLGLIVLTAVFDNVMIAAGLFTYAEGLHLGWFIGLAPVEDFTYPLAALILLPALWARRRSADDR